MNGLHHISIYRINTECEPKTDNQLQLTLKIDIKWQNRQKSVIFLIYWITFWWHLCMNCSFCQFWGIYGGIHGMFVLNQLYWKSNRIRIKKLTLCSTICYILFYWLAVWLVANRLLFCLLLNCIRFETPMIPKQKIEIQYSEHLSFRWVLNRPARSVKVSEGNILGPYSVHNRASTTILPTYTIGNVFIS